MTTDFKFPSLDYSSRDYLSIRDDAIARIPYFTEEWTDHNPQDPGIVLLQLFSGMHDVGHYYLDEKVRETQITSVRGRRSIIGLGALIGQRLLGKAPALALLDFTLQAVQVNPTSIPIGTLVSTTGITPAVFFETTESVIIPAGELSVSGVSAIAGQTFSGVIGASDGTDFQEFQLTNTDTVLDGGLLINADSVSWAYTPALGQVGPADEYWSYRRSDQSAIFIKFGNGSTGGGNGKVPDAGVDIEGFWREGGGVSSSVGAGTIRAVSSSIFAGPTQVSISCNNPLPASGGDEEETVKLARRRMPYAFRSQDRGVVSSDIEALAEGIPGVILSKAVVTGINQWTLWVSPHPSLGVGSGTDPFGYTVLSSVELAQDALAVFVKGEVTAKVMGTDALLVNVVRFRPIDIITEINLLPGANRSEAEIAFAQYVADFFDTRDLVIGDDTRNDGDIHRGDWDSGISAITGVDYPVTSQFQLRPQVETVSAVGQPVFSGISYTNLTQEAIWEVLFISGLSYRVYRKTLDIDAIGVVQTQIGGINTAFSDDNGEIEISVTLPAGATPPMSGDLFRFRSSSRLGSVRMLKGDVAAQGVISFKIIGGA